MQDGKALQSGTSHHLGQNFAKAFDCQYQSKEGKLEYVWATSWGVSTRLVGALIMAHSDDKGLVLPPKLAARQVVIVPILKGDSSAVLAQARELEVMLKAKGVSVFLDDSDQNSPGWKFAEYELQGIPVRIELGPKDVAAGQCVVARRDTSEKKPVVIDDSFAGYILTLLVDIQKNLFDKALALRAEKMKEVETYDAFKSQVETGFAVAYWDGTAETESLIKEETKATIRCIPTDEDFIQTYKMNETGVCIRSGKPSNQKVIFAKAY